MDLWNLAEGDVLSYIEKAAQRHRLKKLGLDELVTRTRSRATRRRSCRSSTES